MNYLLLILSSLFLLISCPQGTNPDVEETPYDDVVISRPETPKEFLPPPPDTNINGVMYVNEDGTLTIPDNEGKLISVHVWMAKEDSYITSSFKGQKKFGYYVKSTGTPPASLYSVTKSLTHNPYEDGKEPTLYLSPSEMTSMQRNRNVSVVNYSKGDIIRDISISGQSAADTRTINAKVLEVTDNAVFLIEDRADYISHIEATPAGSSDTRAQEYVRKFNAAYDNMVRVFGDPATALGGKVKVLIVNFPSGIYGTIVNGYSLVSFNQLAKEGIDLSVATAYHEIQHQITRSRGSSAVANLVWLDEALAEYARHITTYDKTDDTKTLLRSSHITTKSVLQWESDIPSYNYSYLFMQYLVDRFGEEIIHKIIEAGIPKPGAVAYQDEIKPISDATGIPFDELFFDFAIALALLGRKVEISNNEHPFKDFQTRFVDENFIGNASPRIAYAGSSTEKDPGGLPNTLNLFGPYQIAITWWKGDVDTIELPTPVDTRNQQIKGAVFYDKR